MRNRTTYLFIIVLAVVMTLAFFSKVQCKSVEHGESITESGDARLDGSEAARRVKVGKGVKDDLLIVVGGDVQVLRKTGFVTGYAKEWRLPMWTAWNLTASHTTGPYKRKGVKFQEDDEVPYPKAMNSDYYSSAMTADTCVRLATTSGAGRHRKTVSSLPTCVRSRTT